MVDYSEKLRQDLVEQFKEKPVIDALLCAIGGQLTDLHRFFTALREERGVQSAVGKQLDGVGDIVCLSRAEAGALSCTAGSVYTLSDEQYREYLIFKIWKNTNTCTYKNIVTALKMFWPKPLYYQERPDVPATINFRTDALGLEEEINKLVKAPLVKPAGVRINLNVVFQPVVLENGQGFWFTRLKLHMGAWNQWGLALAGLRLDGSARLDGSWYLDQAGAGLAMISAEMALRVPEQEGVSAAMKLFCPLARIRDQTQLIRASFQLAVSQTEGAVLEAFSTGAGCRQHYRISGTLTYDSLWRLEGTQRLDGSKRLDASIVKEEI